MKKRRQRLKKKLLEYYGEKILVLQTNANIPDVIINASRLSDQFTMKDDCEQIVTSAAKYIRSDIENYCNNLPPLNWPPTIEELMKDERMPPTSVILFLNNLLKHSKHTVSSQKKRLVDSYASDFIHGVSNGEVLTPKHFLLGLGLHGMTGQKKPVQIVNRLGHSMTYDKVMGIETTQAQKAQKLLESTELSFLPLHPATNNDSVLTVFWADNFDKVILFSFAT